MESPRSCLGKKNEGLPDPCCDGGRVHEQQFMGVLHIHIHQARDIQNICIYHKQDVYAKFCLTDDPESAVSTKIINGGGRDPVFNDSLHMRVVTMNSSLKCEIYMMSRVKDYLEDQLLGFALVPLSEVLLKNGKLDKEFSLSSTDLFHSPAGFVQLSLFYNGSMPNQLLPSVNEAPDRDLNKQETDRQERGGEEYGKIEFPDPILEIEDRAMISQYIGYAPLESRLDLSLESVSTNTADSGSRYDSPPSSTSTSGVSSAVGASDISDAPPGQETLVSQKEKHAPFREGGCDTSSGASSGVGVEPKQSVVQQEIVDLYTKSMQQFTDSLAKMKLPLDVDSNATSGSGSEPPKGNTRVFYGSRAFF